MGAQGSVAYMYDNLSVVSFKGLSEEETLEAMIEAGIEIDDIELQGDEIVIYGLPQDLYNIKETILNINHDISFNTDEITTLAKEKITITGEDLECFNKLCAMLEDIEDVQHVYHNVNI